MAEVGIVRIDESEMEYFKFGNGKKPFVIIPGLSIQSVIGAKDAVEEAYKIMSDDVVTYVFDRRKVVPDDYSIYDMADDTAAAMSKLGIKNAYVFGASQGGMIAMTMAIRYPKLVSKLILGSTSSHVHKDQRAVIDRWIELAGRGDKPGLCQEFGKEIYPPDIYEQYKDYFYEMAGSVTDEDLKKFIIMARSIRDFDISTELKKIDCPVLVMGVYEDTVLDSDATMEIAENLDSRPDFALYMYKGFGHAAFDTAPDYKDRILEFLRK